MVHITIAKASIRKILFPDARQMTLYFMIRWTLASRLQTMKESVQLFQIRLIFFRMLIEEFKIAFVESTIFSNNIIVFIIHTSKNKQNNRSFSSMQCTGCKNRSKITIGDEIRYRAFHIVSHRFIIGRSSTPFFHSAAVLKICDKF